MTPDELDKRIGRSRTELWQWELEARLPSTNRRALRAIIALEVEALSELRDVAPPDKRTRVVDVLKRWKALGRTLTED